MIQLFLSFLLNLLSTLIQLIVYPINLLLNNYLPGISNQLSTVTNTLNTVFDTITWGLGIIPISIINVLLFIILVEIAKHTVFISTHIILRIWNIFQKIKFW